MSETEDIPQDLPVDNGGINTLWIVVIGVVLGIIGVLIYVYKSQIHVEEEEMDLEVDDSEKTKKAKMIDEFNFEFDFPEIEKYEKAKAAYDENASPQNQNIAVNTLCARAAGLMQKGSLFSQIAPHVEGARRQKLVSQERYDAMLAAKRMLDAEAEDIKEEAEKFKSAFGPDFTKGEQIFKIVGEKMKKLTEEAKSGFDLKLKFPLANQYKQKLTMYIGNKTKENKAKTIRALFDRTWAVMQIIPKFNQIAPRIHNAFQNKQIPESRFNDMKAAKELLDKEAGEIKVEAMRFKADFGPNFKKGEQIFPMVAEMKKTLMAQQAKRGGHGGAGPSFQNAKKAPTKPETKAEKQKKQALAKKAFRELEQEEKESKSKKGKVRKHVPGSLGASSASDLD